MVPRRAVGLAERDGFHVVALDDGDELLAGSVILALGVQYRRLPIPRLEQYEGLGVAYAVDSAREQLRAGDGVVVVGGANSAGQAALAFAAVQGPASSEVGKNGEVVMAATPDNGIISKPSNHSVDQTVEKLKNILQAKGVTLFALVDHSGEAEKAGMKMRPTKLLIFGSPKAGTPLMLASPSSAIDLPLKILIWEDAQEKVWVTYNSPTYLQKRHNLPPELLPNIAVVETLAAKAAE
jgi:uncharacterized protein (DUF302 family)